MPVIMPKALYIHIPHNGGTWVFHMLQRIGLTPTPHRFPSGRAAHHKTVNWVNNNRPKLLNRFVWTSVRSPLTFIRTYWNSRKMHLLSEAEMGYADFTTDIEELRRVSPGCMTAYYRRFLGCGDTFPALDGHIKLENAAADLVAVLEKIGVGMPFKRRRKILLAAPLRVNLPPETKQKLCLPYALAHKFLQAEQEIVTTFGYDFDTLLSTFMLEGRDGSLSKHGKHNLRQDG